MLLSVIMPVYNEEAHLREILRRVRAVPLEKEIICVDDCSRDRSWEILQEEGRQPNTHVFRHLQNMGKGAAVRTGLTHVKGDVVIIQDADLEYDPGDYPRLLAPIQRGETKVVYGSRFLGRIEAMSTGSALGNRFVTAAANLLFRTRLTDMETCYKVFTGDIAHRLDLATQRWGFDPEITAKVIRMGYAIVEVPITYRGRTVEEGKNLRWRDGFSVLFTLIRFRFLP
ncbi:MAG: glycosyltransferase family 2 protein [Chloroflexi bacterium]|nr:glycosyltransferase family 2 protein [Chloroflexota bacterium]